MNFILEKGLLPENPGSSRAPVGASPEQGNPTLSQKSSVLSDFEALFRGIELVIRHHGGGNGVVSSLRGQMSSFLDGVEENVFIKRAKYITLLPMALYLRDGDPVPKVDKDFNFTGPFWRWAKPRLRFMKKKNIHLWYSFLQTKRCGNTVSEDFILQNYHEHRQQMLLPDPIQDESELDFYESLVEPDLEMIGNGLIKELDGFLRDPIWHHKASEHASFEESRASLGQQGYLQRIGERDGREEFEGMKKTCDSGLLWEEDGWDEDIEAWGMSQDPPVSGLGFTRTANFARSFNETDCARQASNDLWEDKVEKGFHPNLPAFPPFDLDYFQELKKKRRSFESYFQRNYPFKPEDTWMRNWTPYTLLKLLVKLSDKVDEFSERDAEVPGPLREKYDFVLENIERLENLLESFSEKHRCEFIGALKNHFKPFKTTLESMRVEVRNHNGITKLDLEVTRNREGNILSVLTTSLEGLFKKSDLAFDHRGNQVLLPYEVSDEDIPILEAKIEGVLEPWKVRVISKGRSVPYYIGKVFQRAVHGMMRDLPEFRLIGEPINSTMLFDIVSAHAQLYGLVDPLHPEKKVGLEKEIERDLKENTLFSLLEADYAGEKLQEYLLRQKEYIDLLRWISMDYKAATDCLSAGLSRRFLRHILNKVRVHYLANASASEYLIIDRICLMWEAALAPHKIFYPPWTGLSAVYQQNGQLMGSIISFVILCLANKALTLRVMFERLVREAGFHPPMRETIFHKILRAPLDRKFRIYPWDWKSPVTTIANRRYITRRQLLRLLSNTMLLNGDDLLYLGDKEDWEVHKRLGKAMGLSVSAGKAYLSDTYANANSTSFHYPIKNAFKRSGFSTPVQINFLNTGLFFGQHKVMGKVDLGEVSQDQKSLNPYTCVMNEIIEGAWNGRQLDVAKQYLALRQQEIKKECKGRNLYLPISVGGMGVRPPVDMKFFITKNQKSTAAAVLRDNPNYRPLILPTRLPSVRLRDHLDLVRDPFKVTVDPSQIRIKKKSLAFKHLSTILFEFVPILEGKISVPVESPGSIDSMPIEDIYA